MSDQAMRRLLEARHQGVLVTLKRDGRPQLSNIAYAYVQGGYGDGEVRISVTEGRAKTANLRRDPRASLHVTSDDFWAYVVAEGDAELTPVANEPGDATVDELVELYQAVGGEHDDWDAYRAAMVADRRLVIHLPVSHLYGMARD